MKQKLIHGLVWLYLLTKRLLKKPIFLLTLILIPIMAFAMSVLTREESSVIRVGLYTAEEDELAERMITQLMEQDSLVCYQQFDNERSAIDAVNNGEIDCAWGFCEDFSEKVMRYAENMRDKEPLILVSEQQESVTLRLAREKLYCTLIPTLSKEIYFAYLANELGYDVESHREELEVRYENAKTENELIHFEFMDEQTDLVSINYLSTPLRGIVAVLMVICGIAVALVFLHEKENGIYSYLSGRKQLPVLMASCFAALVICGIVALISIGLSGNFTTLANELVLMGLYIMMCTLFCTLWGQICRTSSALAICLPIVAVLLLVFCPVFLNHKVGMPLQLMLPTYYYLNAVSAERFIPQMVLYIVICAVLCIVVEELSRLSWLRSLFYAQKHED